VNADRIILWSSVTSFSGFSNVHSDSKVDMYPSRQQMWIADVEKGSFSGDVRSSENSDRILVAKTPILEEVRQLQNEIKEFRENLVTDVVGNVVAATMYDELFGGSLKFTDENIYTANGIFCAPLHENVTSLFDRAWCVCGEDKIKPVSSSIFAVEDSVSPSVHSSNVGVGTFDALIQSITFQRGGLVRHDDCGVINDSHPVQLLIKDLTRSRHVYDKEMKKCIGSDPCRKYSSLSDCDLNNIGQAVLRLFIFDVLPISSTRVISSLYKRQHYFLAKPSFSFPLFLLSQVALVAYIGGLTTVVVIFSTRLDREKQHTVLWCFLIWIISAVSVVQPLVIWIKNYAFSRTLTRDVRHVSSWLRSNLKRTAANNCKMSEACSSQSAGKDLSSAPCALSKWTNPDMNTRNVMILGDIASFPRWALRKRIGSQSLSRTVGNYLREKLDHDSNVFHDEVSRPVSLNAASYFFASNRMASRFSHLLESQVVLSFTTPWPRRIYGNPQQYDRGIVRKLCGNSYIYPAQWHYFHFASSLTSAFVSGGIREYFAEYVFMKVSILTGLVCEFSVTVQDIIVEVSVWILVGSTLLLHYHLANVNVLYVVAPALCVFTICSVFMRHTCRPWETQNSWCQRYLSSRIHVDEDLDCSLDYDMAKLFKGSCCKSEMKEDMVGTNDCKSNRITDGSPDNLRKSYEGNIDTTDIPVPYTPAIGVNHIKSDFESNNDIQKTRHEKLVSEIPDASLLLHREIQKEVMKQLSLHFSGQIVDFNDRHDNRRRLPPLLRIDANDRISSTEVVKKLR